LPRGWSPAQIFTMREELVIEFIGLLFCVRSQLGLPRLGSGFLRNRRISQQPPV
jgi:hypothetical protein